MAEEKRSGKSKRKKHVEIRYVSASSGDKGILAGAKKLLPNTASEQFLVGLLIGAGVTYVLSDENLRGHIIRYAVQTYGNIVGGFEEFREQAADIQAEILADQAANS